MSTTIDERIVEMRFDNKHFERNVQTSLNTVDKLKNSLKFNGATKGLENINAATKGINMSGLGTAVETVQAKFSALGVIGVTALANITNSVVNTGKRMISALTIDPITTGFSEYETKINAIQTIMSNTASKGTTMEDVTRVIGELNTYADKTIYNFAEMTRNIGTFTAAGIGLEESASAIQGIANLAAMSGSSSQQASTAMYQLSQAMASGTVKLMDWNSVVNAGMGGQLFQDALKETAKAHGIAVDDLIEKNGSFRESLQEGWITTEILTETLRKMTKSGAAEYLSQLTGVEQSQIEEAQKLVGSNKDGTASYEELAETLAKTGKITKEKAIDILKMADNAEDAATKVKTFTQLWDTLKESAQSGWSQTWEILVGDFEEAKETLTKISEVIGGMIGASADARNELLQGWKDGGGRADLIDALFNSLEAVLSIVKPIKEAFREIFPPLTVEQLLGFTKGLKELTARLTLSETTANNLKRTFKGLFAILDIVKQVFGALFKLISPLFGGLDDLGGGILGLTATWGDWLVALSETIRQSGILNKAVEKIHYFVGNAAKVFKNFISIANEKIVSPGLEMLRKLIEKIKDILPSISTSFKKFSSSFKEKFVSPGLEILHALLERVGERMSMVGDAAGQMKTFTVNAIQGMGDALMNCNFFKVLQILWDGVKAIGSGLGKLFGSLTGGLIDKLGNADFNGILDFVNSLIAGGVGVGLMKFLKSVTKTFESFKDIVGGVIDVFDGVRGCFEAYQTQLKAGALMKIAGAIAILTAAILVLSLIDSAKLSTAIGAITMLFADLMGSMAIIDKLSGGSNGLVKITTGMIGMSVAVLIMAAALKTISSLNSEELTSGLIGIIGVTATLVAAAKILGSGGSSAIRGATKMVIFAAAIAILASVCKSLSTLSWEELGKGLVGVGVLLAEVSLFMNTAKFSGKSITTATGIVILSAAIKILASACANFATMSWEDIGKGLVAIGGLLAEIALFTNLTGNAKHVISTGIALIAIGAAMKIFVSAVRELAKMSWEDLAKGLVGMAGALTAVTVALNFIPKSSVLMGVGLIAVATAMVILAQAMKTMGSMSWGEIGRSLVTLGGALLILAVGLTAMKTALPGAVALVVASGALIVLGAALKIMGTLSWGEIAKSLVTLAGSLLILAVGLTAMIVALPGAAALVVAAAGLAILTPVLMALGSMSWGEIAKGLLTIAGVFVILGVAGAVLKPLTLTILALSASFVLIGIGALTLGASLLLIGAGLSATAIGFTALATSVAGGAIALVSGLTVIITGIAGLIPVVAKRIGEAIIVICEVIAEGTPVLGEAIKAVVLTLIDVLMECVPVIADGALKLIVGIMSALVDYTPKIVDLIFDFIIAILDGIAKRLPDLIQSAVNVLMSFFSGIVDALGSIDFNTLMSGIAGVGLLAGIMLALSAVASLIPGAMIGVLGIGAVVAELALVMAAIGALAQIPGLDWLINEGGKLLQSIGTAIGQFLGGIVGGFMGGVSSQFPKIGTDLSNFMKNVQPFIDGAKNIDSSAMEGVKSLAGVILTLTAANILDGISKWITGGSSLSTFGEEIASFGPNLAKFSDSVAGISPEAVQAAANAGKALADMCSNIPKEGGIAAWFAGENSISKFGTEIITLGAGLKGFSESVAGVNTESMIAAASAGKALADMCSNIPKEGGIAAWFAGENSISKFSNEIVTLGSGLKGFSDSVTGLNNESIVAAANAGKALTDMCSNVPKEGGIAAWFAGENSISKFAGEIVTLGQGLKGFSDAVVGTDPEMVTTAAQAAKVLAEMTHHIPEDGGVVSWFAGENSISKFAGEIVLLGQGLKGFSDAVVGIVPDNVTSAANAAKAIAQMTKTIPETGGIKAWFTGETSISNFADKLPTLGDGLKGFADSVKGIEPESVTAAANAAKSLGQMTEVVPTNTDKITKFGTNLIKFGDSLKTYFTNTAGITADSISVTKKVIDAVKHASTVDSGAITSVSKAIDKMADSVKGLSKVPKDCASSFCKALKDLGESGSEDFVKPFEKMKDDVKKAAQNAMKVFVEGIEDYTAKAETACKNLVIDAANAIGDKLNAFKQAGKDLVTGFADGISVNTYKAEAKAKAMAAAAAKAARKELDEHSPSKVGYEIGDYFGIAFVNAISDNVKGAYTASTDMANAAKTGLSDVTSTIQGLLDGTIDGQPTIRPVLDLSDIRSGASAIGGLLNMEPSVGVLANAGSISSMMNRRVQNGANDDVISAINKLGKELGSLGGTTYQINGITYEEGTDISDAFRTIIRYANIERRV